MLKRLVQIVLVCIVIAIATGYYFKTNVDALTGDLIIGIAVLAVAFVLMPLFLVYRYKKTSLRKYIFPRNSEEKESGEDQ